MKLITTTTICFAFFSCFCNAAHGKENDFVIEPEDVTKIELTITKPNSCPLLVLSFTPEKALEIAGFLAKTENKNVTYIFGSTSLTVQNLCHGSASDQPVPSFGLGFYDKETALKATEYLLSK